MRNINISPYTVAKTALVFVLAGILSPFLLGLLNYKGSAIVALPIIFSATGLILGLVARRDIKKRAGSTRIASLAIFIPIIVVLFLISAVLIMLVYLGWNYPKGADW